MDIMCRDCNKKNSKDSFEKGYIGIVIFSVIICPNCNSVLWDANIIFQEIFYLFFSKHWNGNIKIKGERENG